MPTNELKQALRSANVSGAEKDLVEVLARMFDADPALIVRVMYAVAQLRQLHDVDWDDHIPSNVRAAIKVQVDAGNRRARLREIVECEGFALASFARMVPESDPTRACAGCPKSLECVAEGLHKPEDCRVGKGAWRRTVETRPIKINKNTVTVECDHPRGRHVLDIEDFDI